MGVLLFAGSLSFIIYVLFGYPVLLAWMARRARRPVTRNGNPRTVTVILCVYNGETWIRDKLQSILNLSYPRELVQVLVVSDGSTDRTEERALEFAAQGVELIRLPRQGKAGALNAGMARARGDILFFTDVRQPLDAEALKHLVACLGDPKVGAVCGQICFIGDAEGAHLGLYWRYEKWIRQNQSRLDCFSAGTGCLYAMRRELVRPVPREILLDDSYLPIAALLRGYRFVFEPAAIAWEYPTSLDSEFRRKVRTLAGVYQLVRYFPGLLWPGNRIALHFFSHKFGRLLVPFAFLLMLGSSFGLPGWWAPLALGGQALLFAAALLEPVLPPSACKRLASAARTFLVLMTASFCAVAVFVLPARTLWKRTDVQISES